MENDRQKWANDFIDNLGSIERLEPNPYLLTRINQKIASRKAEQRTAAKLSVALAGIFAVFICLNIITFIHFSKTSESMASNKITNIQAIASAYDLKNTEY